jgi:hypothetical protein
MFILNPNFLENDSWYLYSENSYRGISIFLATDE